MDEATATENGPAVGDTKPRRRSVNHPELARRLNQYYQLECIRPTSDRMQLLLDEFLRKAGVNTELDHRSESRGGH